MSDMDLTADEAYAIINALKIVMDAIESNQLQVKDVGQFHALITSAHQKLTHKDEGIIQRIN